MNRGQDNAGSRQPAAATSATAKRVASPAAGLARDSNPGPVRQAQGRPLRVLIATVTAGAGHLQAAAALEEAWRSLRPQDTLARLDVLEFTPKLYRKMY